MTGPRDWDEDDRDLPQPIDLDDDGDDTIDCPHCGRSVYEDAAQCPYCGQWIEGELSPAARRARGWFWPIMVSLAVAIILVLWHAAF